MLQGCLCTLRCESPAAVVDGLPVRCVGLFAAPNEAGVEHDDLCQVAHRKGPVDAVLGVHPHGPDGDPLKVGADSSCTALSRTVENVQKDSKTLKRFRNPSKGLEIV